MGAGRGELADHLVDRNHQRSVVLLVLDDHDFLVGRPGFELERSRRHVSIRVGVVKRPVRFKRSLRKRQRVEQQGRRVRRRNLHLEHHFVFVRALLDANIGRRDLAGDRLVPTHKHTLEEPGEVPRVGRIGGVLERRDPVSGGYRVSVVPHPALGQLEGPDGSILVARPRFGGARNDLEVPVDAHQRFAEEVGVCRPLVNRFVEVEHARDRGIGREDVRLLLCRRGVVRQGLRKVVGKSELPDGRRVHAVHERCDRKPGGCRGGSGQEAATRKRGEQLSVRLFSLGPVGSFRHSRTPSSLDRLLRPQLRQKRSVVARIPGRATLAADRAHRAIRRPKR